MELEKIYTTQDYAAYTDEDHQVWETLCRRQVESLRGKACRQFYEGLERINLDMKRSEEVGQTHGEFECRERLGGLLRYYHRKAA